MTTDGRSSVEGGIVPGMPAGGDGRNVFAAAQAAFVQDGLCCCAECLAEAKVGGRRIAKLLVLTTVLPGVAGPKPPAILVLVRAEAAAQAVHRRRAGIFRAHPDDYVLSSTP